MRLLTVACCATIAATALVVTPGQAGAPDSASVTQAGVVTPVVGDCFNLTSKQLSAWVFPTVAAVDCAESHTLEVIKVLAVPPQFARHGYNSMPVWAYAMPACNEAVRRFAGASRDSTMNRLLDWNVMGPTRAQWNGGARWMMCGGQALNWRLNGYLALRGSYQDRTPTAQACARWRHSSWQPARCGSRKAVLRMRQINPFAGMEAKRYPGRKTMDKRMRKAFKRLYGNPKLGYTRPSRQGWNHGSRLVTAFIAGP